MIISMYVIGNEDSKIEFPVTPESYEISDGVNNTTVDISNLGEVILKGKRKLTSISWSCFFPADEYDFCQTEPEEDPMTYVNKIKEIMENNDTVILDIPGIVSISCLITDFPWGQSERVSDISYTITFSEFRNIDTPSVKKQTAKRPTRKVIAHMYKWKKGDTWKKVAKKEAGDSKKYSSLKKTNKSRISAAKKAYKKKHPSVKKIKETTALIGTKILIK